MNLPDPLSWLGTFAYKHAPIRDPLRLPPALARFRTDLRERLVEDIAPHVADLDRHPDEAMQWELLRKAGRAGWLNMLIPRQYGGEFGFFEAFRYGFLKGMIFTEEVAAVCPGVAVLFGAHTLGLLPLFLTFDRQVLKRFLPEVARRASSDRPAVFAFAITEPSAGSDVEDEEGSRRAKLSVFARKTPEGYVLTGRKCFISNGNLAAYVTVFASLGKETGINSWTAFVVPADTKGYSVGRIEHKMGQRASPAAELIFDDVVVPEDHRLGSEGQGWLLNQRALDLSRPGVGAIALGTARTALEHLKDSVGPIDQTPKWFRHELGDLAMKLEIGRTMVWRAGQTFPPDPALSAMAKCFASDKAMEICSRVIDLLGTQGLEQGVAEKAFRDVKLTQIYEGTNQIQRMRIAESLSAPTRAGVL